MSDQLLAAIFFRNGTPSRLNSGSSDRHSFPSSGRGTAEAAKEGVSRFLMALAMRRRAADVSDLLPSEGKDLRTAFRAHPRRSRQGELEADVTIGLACQSLVALARRPLTVGLLNRPQRKPLSRTESGILKVNKINPAIVTSTDERFVVSKDKGGE